MRRPARSRQRVHGGSVPAINPLAVSGLKQDLNMQNVASYTVTGGNTVTSITNTVSSTAYPEATNPPGYNATAINGRPGMVGDGSNDRVFFTEAAVLTALGSSSVAVFYVVKWTIADNQAWVIGGARAALDTAVGHRMFGQTIAGSGAHGVLERSDAGVSGNQIGTVIPQILVPEVVCHRIDNAVWQQLINGAKVDEAAHPVQTITPTRGAIFCRPDLTPDGFLAASLGRALVISPAPSLFVCRGISKHLKSEWGVA